MSEMLADMELRHYMLRTGALSRELIHCRREIERCSAILLRLGVPTEVKGMVLSLSERLEWLVSSNGR